MLWNKRGRFFSKLALGAAFFGVAAALLLYAQTAQQPAAMPASASPPSQPAPTPRYLVMIDPAHGGSDAGAALNPAIPEKDVNLAFARRLRQELNLRGMQAALVRDGDFTFSLDARAGLVNAAQPGLYIAVHTASQGNGMVLYSAMLPGAGDSKGRFLPWDTAQTGALGRSRWAQQQIAAAMQKTGFPFRSLLAAVRPLNNLTVPAISVEVAPTTGDVSQLASVDYQSMVCAALANALGVVAPALRERTP